MNASQPIILIGPVRTGKTTLGKLLAERLRLPQVSLDDLRWGYYREIGYDDALAKEIRQKGGFLALRYYWQLFDAYSVERVLEEYPRGVIDLGAGASVYDSQEQFARVQRVLTPIPNVLLILPSPDPEESIRILSERTRDLVGSFGQGFNWHVHFVNSPCNRLLAKQVVFTRGKTPEETRDEILASLVLDG